jgi:hypothetical protein
MLAKLSHRLIPGARATGAGQSLRRERPEEHQAEAESIDGKDGDPPMFLPHRRLDQRFKRMAPKARASSAGHWKRSDAPVIDTLWETIEVLLTARYSVATVDISIDP